MELPPGNRTALEDVWDVLLMASVDELRKHVLDDTLELAATTGILAPLIEATLVPDKEVHFVPGFPRQHLAQHLALVVTRLHEKPGVGKTGVTASIQALLEHARDAARLSPEQCDIFSKHLKTLRDDFSDQGIGFEELRNFRNSELAHSLHRYEKPSGRFVLRPLWELAHETFELVAELERHLDQTGLDPMVLENRFDIWRERGETFWSSYRELQR
jgi:nucleotidyltransferase/DNA polymerase involved in DNA repair